jgi:hypothetical protein
LDKSIVPKKGTTQIKETMESPSVVPHDLHFAGNGGPKDKRRRRLIPFSPQLGHMIMSFMGIVITLRGPGGIQDPRSTKKGWLSV